MDTKIINPYGVTLRDVVIRKFSSGLAGAAAPSGDLEPMSILPQVVEFTLYQSIFSPILKAQLMVYDAVNLLNNYPLMGEETVEVIIDQQGTGQYQTDKMQITLHFIVAGINNLEFGPNARDQTYIVELHSVESFRNAKRRVSKAYMSGRAESYINDIMINYLETQKQIRYFLTSDSGEAVDRVLVVPNLKPFAALTWLSKMMVPAEPNEYHNFIFYETLFTEGSRFVFKPFQKQTWRDSVDTAALNGAENHKFYYISNYEIAKQSPDVMDALAREGFAEERLILNLKINKRYSVLEKIIGGYFENEYVEINMDQKVHNITKTKVTDQWKQIYFRNYLQTDKYIEDIINDQEDPETSPRVKYAFFNFDETQDPKYRERLGKQEISKLATSQIDLSVDVPTNLHIVPGDLIYLRLPEMHGFENATQDRYLTGHFQITENKMILRTSGESVMLLRVNKDSYFTPIELKSIYALEGN